MKVEPCLKPACPVGSMDAGSSISSERHVSVVSLAMTVWGRLASIMRRRTAEPVGGAEEPDGTASTAPEPLASAEGREAAATFLRACGDIRKAWYETPLLARCNPETIREARRALAEGNEVSIVELMTEMAGPVARMDVREAFDSVAHSHLEMTGIVGRLIVGALLPARGHGERLAPLDVRDAIAGWIATGSLTLWQPDQDAATVEPHRSRSLPQSSRGVSLAKVAHLLVQDVKTGSVGKEESPGGLAEALGTRRAARARLRLVAPLASSVETLAVMHRLSDRFIDLLSASRTNEVHAQREIDGWLQAHPDFADKHAAPR